MVTPANKVMLGALVIGCMFILHQAFIFGYAFETEDVLHHEVFALVLWSFALGVWVTVNMKRAKKW